MLPIMTMKITEKNFPIVAACLGEGFINTYSWVDVVDHYVVINALVTDPFFKKKTTPEYRNSWMTEEDFNLYYKFMHEEQKDQFVVVYNNK